MTRWCLLLLVASSLTLTVTARRRPGHRHGHRPGHRPGHHRRTGRQGDMAWHSRHFPHHFPGLDHSADDFIETALSSSQGWDHVPDSLNWFPSDRFNPFLSSFFWGGQREEEKKQWWQGPNICEKKSEELQNSTQREGEILVHFSTNSQECDLSESAYKCRMVEENVEGRREVTVIFECCHGYARDKGDFGCPKKLELKNLVEKAEELGLTEFLQAVKLLELTDQLTQGNFTVFVPVNGAFGLDGYVIGRDGAFLKPGNTKFLQDAPSVFEVSQPALEKTIKTLQAAVLGHVVVGAHRSSALGDEQVLDTGHYEGSTIRINYFARPDKLMTANCVPVTSRDVMTQNGVIHTVEKALMPVTETLLEMVRTRSDLSMLKTVLSAAEYVPQLQGEGQITLLAPTNGAFQKMNSRLRERLLSGDKKCIERVLLNHMLPHVICSAAFLKHTRTKNLLGKYVGVTKTDEGKLFVNTAQVVARDIMGLNGVLHIVDEVMVPEEALGFLEVLERRGYTELISLVKKSGLESTLNMASNVTLFAPTNQAFEDLPLGLKSKLTADKDLLKKVLTYHMSPGQVNSVHFHHNTLIPSLEGRQVRLNRYSRGLLRNPFDVGARTAGCAPITDAASTDTCNGPINWLDQVMIPPIGNVVDVLAADKRFSTLVGYLKRADLLTTLQEDGPFTVFAPNNDAFERMPKRELDSLVRNPDKLAKLLKSHVYGDNLCCAGISRQSFWGSYVHTMSGDLHRVSRDRHTHPTVAGVKVIKCDRVASNGNILELERLLPRHPFRRWGNHHRRRYNRNYRRHAIAP